MPYYSVKYVVNRSPPQASLSSTEGLREEEEGDEGNGETQWYEFRTMARALRSCCKVMQSSRSIVLRAHELERSLRSGPPQDVEWSRG